jgi:hypothetical protein
MKYKMVIALIALVVLAIAQAKENEPGEAHSQRLVYQDMP